MFLENKSIIFGKVFVLGQLFLFSLKMDGIIDGAWLPALFIWIMAAVTALLIAVFIGIFFIVSKCVTESIQSQKKCGFGFIGVLSFTLGLNLCIPLAFLSLEVSLWISSCIALVFNAFLIIYIR